MGSTRYLKLALALTLVCLRLTGAAAAAEDTWTIQGTVTYPDGRPAAGIELMLIAWSPQGRLDMGNTYWKIPNYDRHYVTSDADGRYVMTGVVDYPQNTTHRYTVYVTEKTRQYHGTCNFPLRRENRTKTVDIRLEEATWVRISLRDRAGQPYEGTRAVYMQTGVDLSHPSRGYTSVRELKFVKGVAEARLVIRDKNAPVGRVAILEFPTAAAAHQMMESRGMSLRDTSRDGLKFTTRDSRGQPLDRQVTLLPRQEIALDFQL
jgi:hypothetical protein